VRQSNSYVIIFALILTIVLGGLLATAAVFLREPQQEAIKLDTRTKILSAVMPINEGDDVNAIYESQISSLVVDTDGDVVTTNEVGDAIVAEQINVEKEFKKPAVERLLPVFEYKEEGSDQVSAYIIPVYGNGLWDRIWGFVALEKDLVTVRGVRFDHKAETPGLGARITDAGVQERYEGKKIYDNLGELVSIEMVKAETGDASIYNDYQVDGMSGATMTANGVNDMLRNYFKLYGAYFKSIGGNAAEIDKAANTDVKENQTQEVE
jgi:Na+-transporting NADH:ubiquinone oxidoreductase subunit C